jgi:hypothetical protein
MNAITLELPDALYKRAQRAAALLERPVKDVLESALNQALPVLDEAPADVAADMARLPGLPDDELWRVARSEMAPDREVLLHRLLDKQAGQKLNAKEKKQLRELHRQAGRLTVLKSQAYALLHQRGFPVPQP